MVGEIQKYNKKINYNEKIINRHMSHSTLRKSLNIRGSKREIRDSKLTFDNVL